MKGKYRKDYIALRSFIHDIRRKKKKHLIRSKKHAQYLSLLRSLGNVTSIDNILRFKLSASTIYLFTNQESPLNFNKILNIVDNYEGKYSVNAVLCA